MTSLVTPEQLGQIFGLVEGADAQSVSLVAHKVHDKPYQAILSVWYELSDKEQACFWAEFSSRYLPCLRRTVFSTSADFPSPSEDPDQTTLRTYAYLRQQAERQSFSDWTRRYTRLHPRESLEQLIVQIERILHLGRHTLELAFPGGMTLGELLFISLSESANALVIHLPYGTETTYTSSDISVRLGRATDRFQPLAAAYDGPNARMNHVLYALASLPESADRICQNRDMSRRSVLSGPGPHTSFYEHQYDWGQCEASRLGPDASPCKPGSPTDYRMCARCECVRYCSRAHQKLRWKVHKNTCFPAKW